MTAAITHHIPQDMLSDYAAGRLNHAFAVTVAAHVSLCDACRAALEAEDLLAGAALDGAPPAAVAANARDRLMAALDTAPPAPEPLRGSDIFPAPVMAELGGGPPAWRPLGAGIRQQILHADGEGSLRLLYIPPERAVPEHSHEGRELTLVLQGNFSDSEGRYGVGDVEVAAGDLEHVPTAGPGVACICLAATDAPLRFRALVPRLLQPLFKI